MDCMFSLVLDFEHLRAWDSSPPPTHCVLPLGITPQQSMARTEIVNTHVAKELVVNTHGAEAVETVWTLQFDIFTVITGFDVLRSLAHPADLGVGGNKKLDLFFGAGAVAGTW